MGVGSAGRGRKTDQRLKTSVILSEHSTQLPPGGSFLRGDSLTEAEVVKPEA